MSDIVARLRGLRFVHVPVASQLMEEAAREIERLRNCLSGYTDGIPAASELKHTLTDAEREALQWFAHYGLPEHRAAALRKLLERLS